VHTHESCRNRPDDVGAGALQRFCEDKAGLVYVAPGCPWVDGYILDTLFFSRPAWSSATSNTNTTTDKAGERHVGSAREEGVGVGRSKPRHSSVGALLLELRADVKMRIRRFRASDS
jgi:hypothetical protein